MTPRETSTQECLVPLCHRVNHVRMTDIVGLYNISISLSCEQLGRECAREEALPRPSRDLLRLLGIKREEGTGNLRTERDRRPTEDTRDRPSERASRPERYHLSESHPGSQRRRAPTPDEWRNLERFVSEEVPPRMVPLTTFPHEPGKGARPLHSHVSRNLRPRAPTGHPNSWRKIQPVSNPQG